MILKIKKEDNIDKMWESILFAMIGKLLAHPESKCVRQFVSLTFIFYL